MLLDYYNDLHLGIAAECEMNGSPLGQAMQWVSTESSKASREAAWTGFRNLFHRPWWQRCWIVQEIAVSHRILLHCGFRSAAWYDLLLFSTCVDLLRYQAHRSYKPTNHIIRQFSNDISHMEEFEQIRRSQSDAEAPGDNLHSILCGTTELSASDQRDKVYALLPLNGERHAAYGIIMDYSHATTVMDVYVAAVQAMIRVDFVYPFDLVGTNIARSAVPSWIPDFDHVPDFGLQVSDSNLVGGPGVPWANFSADGSTMTIAGIKVAQLNQDLAAAVDPFVDDVEEGLKGLYAWITLFFRYFPDRAALTIRVLHEFLTIIWGDEFWW